MKRTKLIIAHLCRNNGNALDKSLKQLVNILCDESSVELQECLTVNRITDAKGIKLVRMCAPRTISFWRLSATRLFLWR